MATEKSNREWKSTACILCTLNCGVKVQLNEAGTEIVRTKGDEDHPASQGYLCNKASRLNFYQNRADRLLTPMKRNSAGGYDPIDWNTAISDIASKLGNIRDEHGGDKIFYYGGGGVTIFGSSSGIEITETYCCDGKFLEKPFFGR